MCMDVTDRCWRGSIMSAGVRGRYESAVVLGQLQYCCHLSARERRSGAGPGPIRQSLRSGPAPRKSGLPTKNGAHARMADDGSGKRARARSRTVGWLGGREVRGAEARQRAAASEGSAWRAVAGVSHASSRSPLGVWARNSPWDPRRPSGHRGRRRRCAQPMGPSLPSRMVSPSRPVGQTWSCRSPPKRRRPWGHRLACPQPSGRPTIRRCFHNRACVGRAPPKSWSNPGHRLRRKFRSDSLQARSKPGRPKLAKFRGRPGRPIRRRADES